MSYQKLKNKLLSKWSGKAESAKVDFAFQITDLMKEKSLTNKALAEKIETSPAYVTKVLRGDQNLSIESMFKIADALDAEVHLKIIDKHSHSLHTLNSQSGKWMELIRGNVKTESSPKSKWNASSRRAIDPTKAQGNDKRCFA